MPVPGYLDANCPAACPEVCPVMRLALLLPCQVALAVRALLCFHMEVHIVFPGSEENVLGVLIGIALNL